MMEQPHLDSYLSVTRKYNQYVKEICAVTCSLEHCSQRTQQENNPTIQKFISWKRGQVLTQSGTLEPQEQALLDAFLSLPLQLQEKKRSLGWGRTWAAVPKHPCVCVCPNSLPGSGCLGKEGAGPHAWGADRNVQGWVKWAGKARLEEFALSLWWEPHSILQWNTN